MRRIFPESKVDCDHQEQSHAMSEPERVAGGRLVRKTLCKESLLGRVFGRPGNCGHRANTCGRTVGFAIC